MNFWGEKIDGLFPVGEEPYGYQAVDTCQQYDDGIAHVFGAFERAALVELDGGPHQEAHEIDDAEVDPDDEVTGAKFYSLI